MIGVVGTAEVFQGLVQDFRLIQSMNVYDNVAYAMRVIGARENAIRKRVPYLLGLVGLNSKARSHPNQLSGGEQQRVALARALMCDPALIFADEPTGNLDKLTGAEILRLLLAADETPRAVVMVTHSSEAAALCDRTLTIADGRITKGE